MYDYKEKDDAVPMRWKSREWKVDPCSQKRWNRKEDAIDQGLRIDFRLARVP
jgi:hypothetical protein